MGQKLTGKQKAWAEAYLETLNKTEASRRAGYKGNDVDLASIGYQNYRKLQIREYIDERLKEMTLSADEVLSGLTQEATASIAMFLIPGTTAIDEDRVHKYGYLIKSLTHTKSGPKIELYDAQSAKVHIGKYHSLFSDNNNAPQEVITYTIDEWRAEQERRKQEASQALEDFED